MLCRTRGDLVPGGVVVSCLGAPRHPSVLAPGSLVVLPTGLAPAAPTSVHRVPAQEPRWPHSVCVYMCVGLACTSYLPKLTTFPGGAAVLHLKETNANSFVLWPCAGAACCISDTITMATLLQGTRGCPGLWFWAFTGR